MNQEASLSFAGSSYACAEPLAIHAHRYDPNVAQLFLHIPKTGGTTVHFVLIAAIAAQASERAFRYRRFRVPRQQGISPIHIHPGWTGGWDAMARSASKEAQEDFSKAYSFVSAHCPFGFHTLLAIEQARYFTLVRDPVAREISSFNFQYQRGYIDRSLRFADYLNNHTLLDNPQVRLLAGRDAMAGPCTETTYQRALATIEQHFLLIASDRQSHSFLCALLGLYGLPAVAYVRSQVTGKKRLSTLPADLDARLRDFHAFDLRLLGHVEHRWRQWLAQYTAARPPAKPQDPILVVGPDFCRTRQALKRPRSELARSGRHGEKLIQLWALEEPQGPTGQRSRPAPG